MRLTRLQLHNVFQHEDFDRTLTGNLIGIIGANGDGKSNLMKSIRYALGGEVPGKTKDQLLRWGTSEGAVVLGIQHQKTAGAITRSVSTNKVEYKFGGEKATGITAVSEMLINTIGMDKDILNTIFVGQAELDKILFDTPSKRELAFQRMCGIGDAAKIHKNLGDFITAKFPPLPNYDEQIALNKLQMQETQDRLTQLEQQLNTAQQLVGQVDVESHKRLTITYQDIAQTIQKIIKLEGMIRTVSGSLSNAQGNLAAVKQHTEGISLDELDRQMRLTEDAWKAAVQYANTVQELNRWTKQKDGLKAPAITDAQVKTLRGAAEEYQRTLGELSGNRGLYDRLLKAISGTTVAAAECPLCGTQITDFAVIKQRLQHKLEELNNQNTQIGSQLTTAKMEADGGARALTAYETELNLINTKLTEANVAVQRLHEPKAPAAQLETELKGMRDVRAQLEQLFRQQGELEANIAANTKYHTEYLKEYENGSMLLRDVPECKNQSIDSALLSVQNKVRQLDMELTQAQELTVRVASLKGQAAELKNAMLTIQKTGTELERRRAQQSTYTAVTATLDKTREWFHYANGPHALAVRVMEDLTAMVNSFLQRLNAPFVALSSTTDLGYRCTFTDGRPMPKSGPPDADELSGGQKVLLAISFRLASYCMFANKQGILAIDEPTAWLDADNVSNFGSLLGKLKEVAIAMDLQLFISSHERQLLPFFDEIIDLHAK